MSTWYIGTDTSYYISHHGILGMKWGDKTFSELRWVIKKRWS